MMALQFSVFAWHLQQKNKKGKHTRKNKTKQNMETVHHPHGELQMFPLPAQQPPVY